MRIIVSIITALVLSGCASAPDIYDRPHTTSAQFQQDFAGCKLVAMGLPQQHTQANSYVANTTTYGNTSNTTIEPNPYAQLGAAIGDAIHNHNQKIDAFRLCMQAQGYSLRPKA